MILYQLSWFRSNSGRAIPPPGNTGQKIKWNNHATTTALFILLTASPSEFYNSQWAKLPIIVWKTVSKPVVYYVTWLPVPVIPFTKCVLTPESIKISLFVYFIYCLVLFVWKRFFRFFCYLCWLHHFGLQWVLKARWWMPGIRLLSIM